MKKSEEMVSLKQVVREAEVEVQEFILTDITTPLARAIPMFAIIFVERVRF